MATNRSPEFFPAGVVGRITPASASIDPRTPRTWVAMRAVCKTSILEVPTDEQPDKIKAILQLLNLPADLLADLTLCLEMRGTALEEEEEADFDEWEGRLVETICGRKDIEIESQAWLTTLCDFFAEVTLGELQDISSPPA